MDKFQTLKQGILSSSVTELYRSPDNKRTDINSIRVVNNGATSLSFSISVVNKGLSFGLVPVGFSLAAGYSCELVDNSPIGLEAGDTIIGEAQDSSSFSFRINGQVGVM